MALIALALAAAVPSSPAWAAGGGGAAPPPATATPAAPPASAGGGTAVGQHVKQAPRRRTRRPRRRRARGPVLTSFKLTRARLFLYGRPARVSFRLSGRGPVRVRLRLVPDRGGPATSIALGERSTGVTHSVALTGTEAGVPAEGSYVLRIAGRDRRGRALRRAPHASSHAQLRFFHHRFPLVGPFSYGSPDARFGAPRSGHTHQGQDLTAAEGTPIVAPRGGVIAAVQYQAGGAGHYAVLDGEAEDRDYVFMHMRTGSIVVKQGQRVRTGQRIGEVGSTGEASGPHLHFEVWTGGWYLKGGTPIDPAPLLRSWAT